jgi:cytochrome P450
MSLGNGMKEPKRNSLTVNDPKKQQWHCQSKLFASQAAVPSSSSTLQPTSSAFSRLRQWWKQLFYALKRKIYNVLWKGTAPDSRYSEYSLPPGPFRCPLRRFGFDVRESTPEGGPGVFFKRQAALLQYPRVWKGLTKTKDPFVVVSGASTIKKVLKLEFDTLISNAVIPFSARIVGTNSIRFANDKKEHLILRKLVGAGSSAEAVREAVPLLQQTAQLQLDHLMESSKTENGNIGVVCMEDACHDFTLHVAWRQILGLRLEKQEEPIFLEQTRIWLSGLFDSSAMEQSMAAREYLVSLIDNRIKELEQEGPDGSTLSKMLFATDNEQDYDDTPRRLTRDQVIDNSLLLILAGSDTSAGTLTAAIFSMGLQPNVWRQVVEEQQELMNRHGSKLDKSQLDQDCPYLDAVVKETMRLFPIIGGSARATKETVVIDGEYQVPKNWAVLYDRYQTHYCCPVTFRSDGSHMDPLVGFQPERWLSGDTCPASEYIPFGAGPRYCLGADLSLAEMKVFLAVMARNVESFELMQSTDTLSTIQWKTSSLFKIPADGVRVSVQPRI